MATVKICGIRDEHDLDVAVRAGADSVGVLVGLTHRSEDEISIGLAQRLVSLVPPSVTAVLVTHFTDPDWVCAVVRETGVSALQLQGDITAPEVASIRSALDGVTLIKALHVTAESDRPRLLRAVASYQPFVDAVDLDSRTDDRLGGTGLVHDWSVSAFISRHSDVPVILSGGLTPANVRDAVCTVNPYGVDVNSGVEFRSGAKSYSKCREFVKRANANAF